MALMSVRLPPSCAIGFKEWRGVCEALGAGRQSIFLRKGGIEEDQGVFRPEHPHFWLVPTETHETEQGLKSEVRRIPSFTADTAQISLLALVDWLVWIEDEEELTGLDEFHVWTQATLRKRFLYRKPGLWLLGVRMFRRAEPLNLAMTAERRGCKSWIPMDDGVPTDSLTPVLDDETADLVRQTILSRLRTPDSSRHE